MNDKIGVVHGRFQLLHNDHLKYILAGKARCEYILVGISNPDITMLKYSGANPHHSQSSANPFTYYERFQMIRAALLERGVERREFDIIPFPINEPELLFNYVPQEATHYITIYDGWGVEKKEKLEQYGYHVEVLWQHGLSEKGISGTDVRQLIREGKDWKELVPASVYRYIIEHQLESKI